LCACGKKRKTPYCLKDNAIKLVEFFPWKASSSVIIRVGLCIICVLTDMGLVTACTQSVQVKLPKKYPVFTLWLVETVTLKEVALMVELKAKYLGLTDIEIPKGGSIKDLYMELTGPTFLTVLVRTIGLLRFGMVMEGRFRSKIEGLVLGQVVTFPTTREIDELL
jgi:hypothetical protein